MADEICKQEYNSVVARLLRRREREDRENEKRLQESMGTTGRVSSKYMKGVNIDGIEVQVDFTPGSTKKHVNERYIILLTRMDEDNKFLIDISTLDGTDNRKAIIRCPSSIVIKDFLITSGDVWVEMWS